MGDMRSTLVANVEGDTLTGTVTDASNGACAPVGDELKGKSSNGMGEFEFEATRG